MGGHLYIAMPLLRGKNLEGGRPGDDARTESRGRRARRRRAPCRAPDRPRPRGRQAGEHPRRDDARRRASPLRHGLRPRPRHLGRGDDGDRARPRHPLVHAPRASARHSTGWQTAGPTSTRSASRSTRSSPAGSRSTEGTPFERHEPGHDRGAGAGGEGRSRLPEDLDTIVLECLEKDPARRYDSARALADDLRRFLDGEPIAARPDGPATRLLRRARKNPALAAMAAGLLLGRAPRRRGHERMSAGRDEDALSDFDDAEKAYRGAVDVAQRSPRRPGPLLGLSRPRRTSPRSAARRAERRSPRAPPGAGKPSPSIPETPSPFFAPPTSSGSGKSSSPPREGTRGRGSVGRSLSPNAASRRATTSPTPSTTSASPG